MELAQCQGQGWARGLHCIVCRATPGAASPGQSWPLPGPEVLGGRSLLEQEGDGRHTGLSPPNTTLAYTESGNDSGMGGGILGAKLDLSGQLKIHQGRGDSLFARALYPQHTLHWKTENQRYMY